MMELVNYKPINGFLVDQQFVYRVGDNGTVWSRYAGGKRPRIGFVWKPLRIIPDDEGYFYVRLRRDGRNIKKYVAHLVLSAFVCDRPVGTEAAHNNGRTDDNCLGNLRWATPKENAADKLLHGTAQIGERHPSRKLTEQQVIEILAARGSATAKEVARNYPVSNKTIDSIWNGRSWKYLQESRLDAELREITS